MDRDDVSEPYLAQLPDRAALDEFASESEEHDSPLSAGSEAEDAFPSELPEMAAVARSSARPAPYATLLIVALMAITAGFWTFTQPKENPPSAAATETIRETRAPSRAPDHTLPVEQQRIVPSATENLSGWWVVTNRIEQSDLDSFKDLTLDFRLQLDQSGTRVRGQGVKWKENGRTIGTRARRPISVDGTLEEGRLALTFTEQGVRRTSHGSFEMQLAEDGSLRGRFASDAAQSSGSARAVRMQ